MDRNTTERSGHSVEEADFTESCESSCDHRRDAAGEARDGHSDGSSQESSAGGVDSSESIVDSTTNKKTLEANGSAIIGAAGSVSSQPTPGKSKGKRSKKEKRGRGGLKQQESRNQGGLTLAGDSH